MSARAKRVRWECPNGCPAVLGSTRPRANATVRYCLSCSADAGVLVERSAPALERKRAERSDRAAARRRAAAARERERARQRLLVPVEFCGDTVTLDVEETVQAMLKLRAVREAAVHWRGPGVPFPVLDVRRRSDGQCSGSAYAGGPITLSFGVGLPREQVEELILHELIHYVLPGGESHGRTFRSTLVRACREWWPGSAVHEVRNQGPVYDMDDQLWRAARSER